MTEWEVFGVIVALVGFIAAVAKPLINLAQSITKLTTVVDRLDKAIAEQKESCVVSHTKLWSHNTEQDEQINAHETRICVLEQMMK